MNTVLVFPDHPSHPPTAPFSMCPAQAAVGLALYYDSGSLREYAVFVAGAAATGVWFVRQHFWFLDIVIGFTHLLTLCKLLLVALVPALLVPGLVVSQASRHTIGAMLMLQVSVAYARGVGWQFLSKRPVLHQPRPFLSY